MNARLLGAVSSGLFSLGLAISANAALVSKLGGQAVYDTDLDITWLANANLAASNTFGVVGINANGTMNWNTANSWITAMNADGGTGYLGFNDWRLPVTPQPDASCSGQSNQGASFPLQGNGTGCTGSEMGHLFYNEFGAIANTSALATGDPTELAKFTNVQVSDYWSGTEFAPDPVGAWLFRFGLGDQFTRIKSFNMLAWAVRPGNVSAVPVPAALWLFGSGLIGLLGLARRKR